MAARFAAAGQLFRQPFLQADLPPPGRLAMKAEYDLSKPKSRKNPYASKLKKPVTMRMSEDVVEYFKSMAAEAGVPCQSLINH
jgi:uncharacterized protein (DUF4415 family)